MKTWNALVAGTWTATKNRMVVINPYTGKPFAEVCLAGPREIETAIAKATKAFETTRKLTGYERSQALRHITEGIRTWREEFAKSITLESGKPIKDSLAEVDRAISTFTIGTEEAKRIPGEYLPVDITPATGNKRAVVGRFPIGPVAGITPFNFPLNLVAHKIAPALAAGNPILLKPASKTPLTALKLGQLILESGWPKEAISILPSRSADAQQLVTDERIKLFSFTGSADNGWKLKSIAGKKKVVLELGGNAAAIIDEDADLDWAVQRCAWGGYYYSGQNCIHVQRILCHEKVFDRFVKGFIGRVKKFKLGDPLKPDTDMSVMIDEENTRRINAWVGDALAKGGKLLYRGRAPEGMAAPMVLTQVPEVCDISCKEAFGPVVLIDRFTAFEEALQRVNDSAFGLQAGVFTKNITKAWNAFETLDVGGVIINDVPTFRVDNMPYGGIKDSGLGREGVKYAIDDMTEPRVMVVHLA
jgi:glyceraldehyde-3-phosphate dehydrogenase (NADP+)